MKKVFLYISNSTLPKKLEEELTSNDVQVITVSEQSLDRCDNNKVQELTSLIDTHKVTHVESSLRYLETMVFNLAQAKGLKALSSIYETVFFSGNTPPKHMGVGEVVAINNEPDIDEVDVIAKNFSNSYLAHFA